MVGCGFTIGGYPEGAWCRSTGPSRGGCGIGTGGAIGTGIGGGPIGSNGGGWGKTGPGAG